MEKRIRRYYINQKQIAYKLLGGKCSNPNCLVPGGCVDWRCLQVDHINSKEKKKGAWNTYKEVIKDPLKYQLLCSNCNWIKRYEKEESSLVIDPFTPLPPVPYERTITLDTSTWIDGLDIPKILSGNPPMLKKDQPPIQCFNCGSRDFQRKKPTLILRSEGCFLIGYTCNGCGFNGWYQRPI